MLAVLTDVKMYERTEPGSSLFIEVYFRGDKAEKVFLAYAQTPTLIKYVQQLSIEELTSRLDSKLLPNVEMSGICDLTASQVLGDESLMDPDHFMQNVSKAHGTLDLYR